MNIEKRSPKMVVAIFIPEIQGSRYFISMCCRTYCRCFVVLLDLLLPKEYLRAVETRESIQDKLVHVYSQRP